MSSLTMCQSETCPLSPCCARHWRSGAKESPEQDYSPFDGSGCFIATTRPAVSFEVLQILNDAAAAWFNPKELAALREVLLAAKHFSTIRGLAFSKGVPPEPRQPIYPAEWNT